VENEEAKFSASSAVTCLRGAAAGPAAWWSLHEAVAAINIVVGGGVSQSQSHSLSLSLARPVCMILSISIIALFNIYIQYSQRRHSWRPSKEQYVYRPPRALSDDRALVLVLSYVRALVLVLCDVCALVLVLSDVRALVLLLSDVRASVSYL